VEIVHCQGRNTFGFFHRHVIENARNDAIPQKMTKPPDESIEQQIDAMKPQQINPE
jgi:hypothetical protein